MSKPVSPVRSTPVAPVAERGPALAGAWMTTWAATVARSESAGWAAGAGGAGGGPAVAGAWMTTWSVTVARSNSVVEVAASRSLLVYAAPVTPVAAAGAAGGATRVSGVSTTVAASGVAKGWRRFWPLSLTIRRALAAGVEATPEAVPAGWCAPSPAGPGGGWRRG